MRRLVTDAEKFAAELAALLLANGETTEGARLAAERLGFALGLKFDLLADWGELTLSSPRVPSGMRLLATPLAVDVGRVVKAKGVAALVAGAKLTPSDALAHLAAIQKTDPVSLLRFALMSAGGASGLGVIFGASDSLTLAAIGCSAGAGACLRRALSHLSGNPFLQPFAAAVLAGFFADSLMLLDIPVSGRLLATCPCMVLVPGPHFLNGMMDLVHARVPFGLARLAYAGLVVVAISTGLLLGLQAEGGSLAQAGPTPSVPLTYDVCAAGLAVAAYGSFFNMPWRMLPLPIMVGMLAHALRWVLLSAGFSLQAGAFLACLVVGSAASLVAQWMRIPFGAFAFASVVSLIPGVFLFQAASQVSSLLQTHSDAAMADLLGLVTNLATSSLVIAAMALGLILPKLCLDRALATTCLVPG